MKGLNQFLKFDWDSFSGGKEFTTTSVAAWVDFESKKHMGTKVEVVISLDSTQYRQKEGQQISNLYEKLTFKTTKDVHVPIGAKVIPINVTATVYGEYKNLLSVRCDDLRVVQSGSHGEA
ncbi:MAG: hypothetical protein Q4P84_08150 [Elusimicrobiales bacterium]|nr:hypothetical protein [Elusimicrobiales bacterium]